MPRRRRQLLSNGPSQEDIQAAVGAVEDCLGDLLREKAVYMERCKAIRAQMATEYEMAKNRGIKTKLLKKIIVERDLARKLAALAQSLADEERNELEMLRERLGDFINSPLGVAAAEVAASQPPALTGPTGPTGASGDAVLSSLGA